MMHFFKKEIEFNRGSIWSSFLIVLLAGISITFVYAYLIWYFQVVGISLIFFYVLSKTYGYLMLKSYGRNFFDSIANRKNGKLFSTVFILSHLLIFWYVYWIFWIDLLVNQTKWEKVTYSWLPIDNFRITTTDINDLLFLTLHPEKVISILKVNAKFGYYEVFGNTFTGELVYLIWLLEIAVMCLIMYKLIFNKKPSGK